MSQCQPPCGSGSLRLNQDSVATTRCSSLVHGGSSSPYQRPQRSRCEAPRPGRYGGSRRGSAYITLYHTYPASARFHEAAPTQETSGLSCAKRRALASMVAVAAQLRPLNMPKILVTVLRLSLVGVPAYSQGNVDVGAGPLSPALVQTHASTQELGAECILQVRHRDTRGRKPARL